MVKSEHIDTLTKGTRFSGEDMHSAECKAIITHFPNAVIPDLRYRIEFEVRDALQNVVLLPGTPETTFARDAHAARKIAEDKMRYLGEWENAKEAAES